MIRGRAKKWGFLAQKSGYGNQIGFYLPCVLPTTTITRTVPMSLRQKLTVVLGATLLAAACSSPTAPKACDVPTMGSGFCATN